MGSRDSTSDLDTIIADEAGRSSSHAPWSPSDAPWSHKTMNDVLIGRDQHDSPHTNFPENPPASNFDIAQFLDVAAGRNASAEDVPMWNHTCQPNSHYTDEAGASNPYAICSRQAQATLRPATDQGHVEPLMPPHMVDFNHVHHDIHGQQDTLGHLAINAAGGNTSAEDLSMRDHTQASEPYLQNTDEAGASHRHAICPVQAQATIQQSEVPNGAGGDFPCEVVKSRQEKRQESREKKRQEPKPKRLRGPKWKDPEIKLCLEAILELGEVTAKARWKSVSLRLSSAKFERSSKQCEDLWGTLIKRLKHIDTYVDKNSISGPYNSWDLVWNKTQDQRAECKLPGMPGMMTLDWYSMMKKIQEINARKSKKCHGGASTSSSPSELSDIVHHPQALPVSPCSLGSDHDASDEEQSDPGEEGPGASSRDLLHPALQNLEGLYRKGDLSSAKYVELKTEAIKRERDAIELRRKKLNLASKKLKLAIKKHDIETDEWSLKFIQLKGRDSSANRHRRKVRKTNA